MISEELFDIFNKNDLTFFTGVPDSTFKSWMSFLEHEHGKKLTQIIDQNNKVIELLTPPIPSPPLPFQG